MPVILETDGSFKLFTGFLGEHYVSCQVGNCLNHVKGSVGAAIIDEGKGYGTVNKLVTNCTACPEIPWKNGFILPNSGQPIIELTVTTSECSRYVPKPISPIIQISKYSSNN